MAKKPAAKKTVSPKAQPKKLPLKGPLKTPLLKKQKQDASPSSKNSETSAKTAPAVETFLKVGAKAPTFKLFNQSGTLVSLSDFKGRKVVLYFYPKDSTPGCTQESCDFRDQSSALQKLNTVVLGVSRDSVSSHFKFQNKFELPFALLADEEGKVCEAYGVWKEKSMYGRKYMGIERSTFVIDESGKLLKIYPKVSVKDHVSQIIEDLK